jgi:hypothetical protein
MLSAVVAEAALGFPWMLSTLCCWGIIWVAHGCRQPFVVEATSWVPWTLSNCMICHRLFEWVAVTRTCFGPNVVGIDWDPSDCVSEVDFCFTFQMDVVSRLLLRQQLCLKEMFFIQNLFVVSPMVRSINYFWVLPTSSIPVKGKRFTLDCWIVSRFSC